MESIDKLALTCKILFENRIIEQRQEIERLKKELKAKVFVVVTEDFYGGGSKMIKLFRKEEDATKYEEEVGINHGLDTGCCQLKIN